MKTSVMTDEQNQLPATPEDSRRLSVPSTDHLAANFKMVLLVMVGVSLVLLATPVIVALKVDHPNESLQHTMCDFLFLGGAGFGTLTGLLKGRFE
jgi:hypothetical protein